MISDVKLLQSGVYLHKALSDCSVLVQSSYRVGFIGVNLASTVVYLCIVAADWTLQV